MDLKFRESLDHNVQNELDQYTAALNQHLYAEHDENGGHADIEPTSVLLQGAKIGVLTDLTYDATRYKTPSASVWTVTQANVIYQRFMRLGQLVYFEFAYQHTTITVGTTSELIIRVPELAAIAAVDENGQPQNHVGGQLYWNDIAGVVIKLGQCSANAVGFTGIVPYTEIHLYGGNAALTNNLWLAGSLWFSVNPNNVATPFYGL